MLYRLICFKNCVKFCQTFANSVKLRQTVPNYVKLVQMWIQTLSNFFKPCKTLSECVELCQTFGQMSATTWQNVGNV